MQGYKVLTEIQELIKQEDAPKAKFVGKSLSIMYIIPLLIY